MVANKSGITQLSLFKSEEDESRVDNFITPFGAVVAKKWTTKRLSRGANWSQPCAEFSAQQLLKGSCLMNTALSLEFEEDSVTSYYLFCGENAQEWRTNIIRLISPGKQHVYAKKLAQHIGVHLLMALGQLQQQGLVHRDVTPTNVLMSQWFGDVYLSDFGLICPAGELRGFVAGYNLSYIPPEMITQDNSGIYVINSDPAKLSQVAQTSADIFQAGFTLYELYTACRPPGLESVPMGSSSSDPAVMSEYLSRVATYDWQAAINSNVRPSNPGLAALLDVMLLLNPQARHSPAQLLQQPYLAAKHAVAVEEVEQRQQNWTAERAAARKALKYLKADSAVTRLAEDGLMLPVMAARAAAATAALVATASSDADKPDAAGQQQQKQDSEPIDDSSNSSRSSIEAPDTPSAVASAATSQGCANSSSESSSSGSPGPQQQKTQVTEPQIVVMFIKVPCEALSAPCSSDHTAKAAAAAVRDVKDAAHQCNLHGDSSVMLSSTDEQMSSTKVSPPTSSGCSSSTTALATMVTAAAPHSSAVSTITAATTAACSIEQASNGEEVLCTTATMPESQLQRCEQQQHQQQDQDSSGGSPPRRRPLTNAVLKVGSLVKRILGRRKSQGTSMC